MRPTFEGESDEAPRWSRESYEGHVPAASRPTSCVGREDMITSVRPAERRGATDSTNPLDGPPPNDTVITKRDVEVTILLATVPATNPFSPFFAP